MIRFESKEDAEKYAFEEKRYQVEIASKDDVQNPEQVFIAVDEQACGLTDSLICVTFDKEIAMLKIADYALSNPGSEPSLYKELVTKERLSYE